MWNIQAEGQPNRTDAEITAYDHLIYLTKRLCKQGTGDPQPFNLIDIGPTIKLWVTAPEIMAAFVQNAIDDPNASGFQLSVGTVQGGGVDVTGVPMGTPVTLDQMRQMMLSTGQLAMKVNPGFGSSTVDFTIPPTGVGGASQTFNYQTGSFNSQSATVTYDMDELANAVWYFLGPRGPRAGPTAPLRPRGIPINHWAGSITPSAANAGGDGDGPLPGQPWPPATVARFMGSRATYGYAQEIRIFDANEDEQTIRDLYEEMWNNEAWIRATPRQFVGIKPERGVSPTFNVGDFVAMAAGTRLHGGVSGTLQVFEFEVEINVNGIVAITEIVASADEAGAPALG